MNLTDLYRRVDTLEDLDHPPAALFRCESPSGRVRWFGRAAIGTPRGPMPFEFDLPGAETLEQAVAAYDATARARGEAIVRDLEAAETRAILSGAAMQQRRAFHPRVVPPPNGKRG